MSDLADNFSKFDPLWWDTPEFEIRLGSLLQDNKIDAEDAQDLRTFFSQGYIILPGAVSEELVDRILSDVEQVREAPDNYILKSASGYASPDIDNFQRATRIIDLHGNSESAVSAMFAPKLRRFLKLMFGGDVLAFQSLYFHWGSQQAIHQDTAYVVCEKPMHLAASWIALEDVSAGSGELIYYEGSHRNPEFLFGDGNKSWLRRRDGDELNRQYVKYLHDASRERNRPLRSFLAKKGDVLVWHADLAHGGARITNGTTRRSLVTHYCPANVEPKYFDITSLRSKLEAAPGCFYSTRHYNLAAPRPRLPAFMGQTRRRRIWPAGDIQPASDARIPFCVDLTGVSISDKVGVDVQIECERDCVLLVTTAQNAGVADPGEIVKKRLVPGKNAIQCKLNWPLSGAEKKLFITLNQGTAMSRFDAVEIYDEI